MTGDEFGEVMNDGGLVEVDGGIGKLGSREVGFEFCDRPRGPHPRPFSNLIRPLGTFS